ncbi:hypothetical protein KP509_27G066900 [Ceratopteris richardii]|nr:hypothetical protein KP509_27G066900 [Ceratopteris richardii]
MAIRSSHGLLSSCSTVSQPVEKASTFFGVRLKSSCVARPKLAVSFKTCVVSHVSSAVSDGVQWNNLQSTPEARKFKEELYEAMETSKQGLNDKCMSIVASLEQLRHVPDLVANPDAVKGRLIGLKGKYKENRMDGKQRYLDFEGSPTTLGASSFMALKPPNLDIVLYTSYQDVCMDGQDSYALVVDVDVQNPDGGNPLPAQIANRARFSIVGPNSLDVEFYSVEIKPRFPETDLDAWISIFKEANSQINENGVICAEHKKPIKGRTDIIYMDDEIRIHRGHKGGVSVLRLLKDPI